MLHTCTPTDRAREIEEILETLKEHWLNNQYLRFWQLLFAIWYLENDDSNDWVYWAPLKLKDPFNKSDEILLELLKKDV
jgi:hypothetical protein